MQPAGDRVEAGRERLEVRVEQLGELPPLLDRRDDRVLVAQAAQHARVGRVPGLALAAGVEAEAGEQDLGQLLRRADGERAAGEPGDLVAELVDAVAHARRDLAEPVRVHLDAGGLHLREHAHERQLDLAEQPLEAELDAGAAAAPRPRAT